MAPKNIEEDIVHRIQRAISKELKRLRRQSRSTGNGHASSSVLARQAETMTRDSVRGDVSGGRI